MHTYHCNGSLHIKAPDDIAAWKRIMVYGHLEFILKAVVAHCPLNRSNEPAHHPNNVKHKVLGEEGIEGKGGKRRGSRRKGNRRGRRGEEGKQGMS